MRTASALALAAIMVLPGAAALAESDARGVDNAVKTAIDDAKQANSDDPDFGDDPQGPLCATSGGKPMSLLGVQYQGGPNVHGTVMALADNDPLRVALTKKEKTIDKLNQQQAADMKSFPTSNSYGWKATVASLDDSIDFYSEQVAGREETIAKLKRRKEDYQKSDPNGSVASFDTAIAENTKERDRAKAQLADAQTRLPLAQAGLAKYDAAMARAQIAKAGAEKAAIAAAASCP